MMENVLEDVAMPDSHSHNMVSSNGLMMSQIDIKTDAGMDKEEESIFNLSQAIANRQKIEQQTHLIMRYVGLSKLIFLFYSITWLYSSTDIILNIVLPMILAFMTRLLKCHQLLTIIPHNR